MGLSRNTEFMNESLQTFHAGICAGWYISRRDHRLNVFVFFACVLKPCSSFPQRFFRCFLQPFNGISIHIQLADICRKSLISKLLHQKLCRGAMDRCKRTRSGRSRSKQVICEFFICQFSVVQVVEMAFLRQRVLHEPSVPITIQIQSHS